MGLYPPSPVLQFAPAVGLRSLSEQDSPLKTIGIGIGTPSDPDLVILRFNPTSHTLRLSCHTHLRQRRSLPPPSSRHANLVSMTSSSPYGTLDATFLPTPDRSYPAALFGKIVRDYGPPAQSHSRSWPPPATTAIRLAHQCAGYSREHDKEIS